MVHHKQGAPLLCNSGPPFFGAPLLSSSGARSSWCVTDINLTARPFPSSGVSDSILGIECLHHHQALTSDIEIKSVKCELKVPQAGYYNEIADQLDKKQQVVYHSRASKQHNHSP
jgi:hypothetical protein